MTTGGIPWCFPSLLKINFFFFRWGLEIGSMVIKIWLLPLMKVCFSLLSLLFSIRGYPEMRLKFLLVSPFLFHFYSQWLCLHWGPHYLTVNAIASQFISPSLIYSVPYHQINLSEILLVIALLVKLCVASLYPRPAKDSNTPPSIPSCPSFPLYSPLRTHSPHWVVSEHFNVCPCSSLEFLCSISLAPLFNLLLKAVFN